MVTEVRYPRQLPYYASPSTSDHNRGIALYHAEVLSSVGDRIDYHAYLRTNGGYQETRNQKHPGKAAKDMNMVRLWVV